MSQASVQTLSDRISTFYTNLHEVMSHKDDKEQWAIKLSGELSSLDYALFRQDPHAQPSTIDSRFSDRQSRRPNSTVRRPGHPIRIKFLALTVIKVLQNGGAEGLEMKEREYERWRKGLIHFNERDREGPKLSNNQLGKIIRASSAILWEFIPPDAALNIIADYMIAQDAQQSELVEQILRSLEF